jgi:hypothetical protein
MGNLHVGELFPIVFNRLHGTGRCTIAEAIGDAKSAGQPIPASEGIYIDDGTYKNGFEEVFGLLERQRIICPHVPTDEQRRVVELWNKHGSDLDKLAEALQTPPRDSKEREIQAEQLLHGVKWALVDKTRTAYDLPASLSL